MKRIILVLLATCLCMGVCYGASASVLTLGSTSTSNGSDALYQNIDRAISALNGTVIVKGQTFSFNEAVGARTTENGYTFAPNGNGVDVMGGGVSQVATTLYMALRELGEGIAYDEHHTFGAAFKAGYAEKAVETVLTDYSRGLDFRFTSGHAENLSVSMWRSGNVLFCQLTGTEATDAKPTASPAPGVSPEPEASAQPTDSGTFYTVNAENYINLRASASSQAEVLVEVPRGESVRFLEEKDGEFLKVEYDGKTGYAHGDYLRLHSTDAETLTVVNCRESVTLRKEPSTSAEALANVPLGSQVRYLFDVAGEFLKVAYDNETGYILTEYLSA